MFPRWQVKIREIFNSRFDLKSCYSSFENTTTTKLVRYCNTKCNIITTNNTTNKLNIITTNKFNIITIFIRCQITVQY